VKIRHNTSVCVAVCCRVLQSVAVFLQCVAVCCIVLQCVAVSVLQSLCCSAQFAPKAPRNENQNTPGAVCFSVLQCVAVRCSQCVAVAENAQSAAL